MNWVITMNVAIVLSTAATVAIAFLAYFNYQLAAAINERDNEHKEQIAELFKAFVIMAGVAGAGRETERTIADFQKRYKQADGKIELFPKQ